MVQSGKDNAETDGGEDASTPTELVTKPRAQPRQKTGLVDTGVTFAAPAGPHLEEDPGDAGDDGDTDGQVVTVYGSCATRASRGALCAASSKM